MLVHSEKTVGSGGRFPSDLHVLLWTSAEAETAVLGNGYITLNETLYKSQCHLTLTEEES